MDLECLQIEDEKQFSDVDEDKSVIQTRARDKAFGALIDCPASIMRSAGSL